MSAVLTAYLYEGDVVMLVSPPQPAPRRPRCLHCCRGRDGLDADQCCEGCRERGHAGAWDQCAACAQERLLLAGRAVERRIT